MISDLDGISESTSLALFKRTLISRELKNPRYSSRTLARDLISIKKLLLVILVFALAFPPNVFASRSTPKTWNEVETKLANSGLGFYSDASLNVTTTFENVLELQKNKQLFIALPGSNDSGDQRVVLKCTVKMNSESSGAIRIEALKKTSIGAIEFSPKISRSIELSRNTTTTDLEAQVNRSILSVLQSAKNQLAKNDSFSKRLITQLKHFLLPTAEAVPISHLYKLVAGLLLIYTAYKIITGGIALDHFLQDWLMNRSMSWERANRGAAGIIVFGALTLAGVGFWLLFEAFDTGAEEKLDQEKDESRR